MIIQNPFEIKEKIISIIQRKGPSLPVHIASEIGLSILFTSAFLSELLSEKKIKISDMKVGSSPLYLISGQEPLLEKFSEYIKSKEKEAYLLLKEKKFLKDIEQEPAIMVALRQIRDFAIPFKRDDEVFWRYFTAPENEFIKETHPIVQQTTITNIEPLKTEQPDKQAQIELNIFDKTQIKKAKTKEKRKEQPKRKKTTQKQNERFFNKIKEFLIKENIEILDIISFNKNELILKVNQNGAEKLLIAYNKRKINENDIIKAHKKTIEINLPYIILSLGEPSKKLDELIESIGKLEEIRKIKE